MTRDERLIAYVDGELSAEDRASFEAEMAADPALAAEVELHRALAAKVGSVYAAVLDEPVPPQLIAVATAANDRRPTTRRRLAPWMAAAASLAIGVFGGRMLAPAEQGPLASSGGVLVARADLEDALSTKLAADPGPVKVGLTVRGADGRYCRSFESAADHLAGLACREDGRWAARVVTAWTPPVAAPAYRMAASETPAPVLAALDDLGGQALDAAQERAARDRGWR